MLLNYETKKHYLALEKDLLVLAYFLKFTLYFYLTPFKFSLVKRLFNYLVIVIFSPLNVYMSITEKKNYQNKLLVTSQCGFHQIINEPTHVLKNSSSCIDLIFKSQPNLVIDSSAHPSLHPNCHHQIVYAKFNLKIYCLPPYEREIWHYGQENTKLIRRAVHEFDWQRTFSNPNIDERVSFFNKTILNIVSNLIPYGTVKLTTETLPGQIIE